MVKVCGGLAPTARPLLSSHLCQASSEATSQGSGAKETDDEHSDGIVLHNAHLATSCVSDGSTMLVAQQ